MPGPLKSANRGQRGCLLLFALPWTAFSLFWILSAGGSGAGFFALFGLPFVAIGLGMVWFALAPSIAGMKVAPPEVTLSRDSVRVGEEFNYTYRQAFKSAVEVKSITIQLIFRESATYQRGTNTTTVTHDDVVYKIERPGQRFQPGAVFSEEGTLQIPPEAMHSFAAPRNKLRWLLKLRVDITGWPDVNEEYDVTVLPERVG